VTKHDGVQVEPIRIYQAEIGEALRQIWSGTVNLPDKLSLQPTYCRLTVFPEQGGVGAYRLRPKRALSRLTLGAIILYLMLGPGIVRRRFGLDVAISSIAGLGLAAVTD
jgi:hypothetical protein